MFNRLYENIKKIIRENYKSILFLSLIYLALMWPMDYYITTGGGTINIKDRVEIKDAYKAKGSLHLAYVSELKANVATYLLSYVIPDWERVSSSTYKVEEEEDIESVDFRNRLQLTESIDAAIKVAYQLADKKFEIKKEHIYIIYVSSKNKKSLKVGDEILLVAGEKVESTNQIKEIINSHEVGDKITFKIKRNEKEKDVTAKIAEENHQKLVGISTEKTMEYQTDPEIKLTFKRSESGPSGGMMLTLDIYNKLTKKDITKGYKIVGTGTIEDDGSVGEIGGVKYKLMGAVAKKADIFLVPEGENYKEAKKEAKKKNYDIEIIGVKNMEDVLTKLEKLPEKKEKR